MDTSEDCKYLSTLNNLYADRHHIVRQIERHIVVNDTLYQVDRKVQDIAQKTKSEAGFSDFISTKLQYSRDGGQSGRKADQDIDRDLNHSTSRRAIVSSNYIICSICKEKILTCCLIEHNLVCRKSCKKEYLDQMSKVIDDRAAIAVRPQPIKNLRLTAVSFDAIHLAWDLPIFDGGEQLIDFEISYCACSKRNKKKIISMSCLRWCKRKPLVVDSFVLDGLNASSHYFGIRIRCKNSRGWSDYSTPIDSVKTGEPVKPLPPQRFKVTRATSNSISFAWSRPFHTGGGNLIEYELSYEEMIPVYKQEAGMGNQGVIMEKKVVKINKENQSLHLSNLPGNADFQSIRLKAKNNFGLMSDYVTCQNIKTCELSRENEIIEEINRIEATAVKFVDSDFFQRGVLQRDDRASYLQKLYELLAAVTQKKDLDIETRDKRYLDNHGKDYDVNRAAAFRKDKFEFRIDCLKQEIKESKNALQEISTERAIFARSMQQAQDQIFLLKAELNNCLTKSTEEYFCSSILNGSTQKLKREDLKRELEVEIRGKMMSILSWKIQVIVGDKKSSELVKLIGIKQEHLKERLEGYKSFERSLSISSRMRSKVHRQKKDIVGHHFIAWKEYSRHTKKTVRAFDRISKIRYCIILRLALRNWQMKNSSTISNFDESKYCSKGGLMLSKVYLDQQMAQEEAKGTMIDFYEHGERNTDLRGIPQKELLDTKRGDHYHQLGRFEDAITIYLVVLEGANSCISMTQDTHRFYCTIEEKIARAYMKEKLWDNAILHLDSLFCRAKSFQFSEFITSTASLLGECYLESGEIELAKESYINGLEQLQDSTSQCSQKLLSKTYKGLYRCYDKMDDESRSSHYKDLHHSTSITLNDKINATMQKAIGLKNHISNTSVKEGYVIHFQNASFNYIQAKTKIKKLEMCSKEKIRECQESTEEIKRLHCLTKRITEEMSRISSNGEIMQTSSLVHDNKQKIDTVELVERLQLRKKFSEESLQNEIERDRNIRLQVKNMEDEKSILLKDIDLEQGQLIQKILKKRIIRCMAFNAMNKSGVDVFGTKSAGTKLIVLTMETDIYIYDMVKGSLVNVFVGGYNLDIDRNSNGHTSIVTCIFYHGERVFSGAMDKTLRCWNIKEERLEFVATGHKATVTSIFADGFNVITGSADKTIIIWDSLTGQMVYRAMGHSRGISSLDCTSSWCISGDTDGEILIWKMNEERNKLQRKQRLQVNKNNKITVIRYNELEIIAGDASGVVSIWWLDNSKLLQSCRVHDRSITDLQFDATILVTCSMDATIKVLDVTTCQILQTIRGHESPVLSICFDRTMILSLCNNGTMKRWLWQHDTGSNSNDIYHTFSEGESLHSICEHYCVTMVDLLKWNANRDITKITVGQELIVIKGTDKKGDNKCCDKIGRVGAVKGGKQGNLASRLKRQFN